MIIFFRNEALEDTNKFWLSAIRRADKLLNAMVFEFSVQKECAIEDVELISTIHDEEPEIDKLNSVLFTGLTITSANIDSETKKLMPAQHKLYNQEIPFVKITFRKKEEEGDSVKRGNLYECPIYETHDRNSVKIILHVLTANTNL